MALGNLAFNVGVNAGPAITGLAAISAAAQHHFEASGSAVDGFREQLVKSSADLAAAAKVIDGGMAAANDAMVKDMKVTEDAVQHLTETVKDVKLDSVSEKIAKAFGSAFGASYASTKTWLEKTEEAVVAKAKVIGIGLAIGLVSATAAALYTAYKFISSTVNFVQGLFTGESYKSENIDALIAMNNQVKELQATLNLSANDAQALGDAMSRLGVNKTDYTATYTNAAKAMRTNGDELDRLGIKYKDVNGELLKTDTFLANVKQTLDEYSAGYDRNAAAAAIGAGSYEQINEALKINQNEIQASKDELEKYGLLIGPGTQAYVLQYEQAMRDFDNQTTLTSQGFKRAIADSIMPALTDLAVWFKDGWPGMVQAFRVGISAITGLFYALKIGVYIVAESILSIVDAIGKELESIGLAAARALIFDLAGAGQALAQGYEGAKNRIATAGFNIAAQIESSNKAIALAVEGGGKFDTQPLDATQTLRAGKKWAPAPKPEAIAPATATAKSAYATYIEELDRMIEKVNASEYASQRLKAEQLAQKEGITDLSEAYNKINAIQRGDSQKVVDEYTRKLSLETAEFAFQTSIIEMTTQEQNRLTLARTKSLEVDQLITAAKKSSKPLDQDAIDALTAQASATIALSQAQVEQRRSIERSGSFGANKALQKYADDAANTAEQVSAAMGNGLKGMEDALVKFATTGKISFKSLADSILSDMARIWVKQNITAPLANFLPGIGSMLGFGAPKVASAGFDMYGGATGAQNSAIMSLVTGGARATGGPVDPSLSYMVGERGPELFVPTAAGTIVPNSAGSSKTNDVVSIVIHNTIGSVASQSDVVTGMRTVRAQIMAEMARGSRMGGATA